MNNFLRCLYVSIVLAFFTSRALDMLSAVRRKVFSTQLSSSEKAMTWSPAEQISADRIAAKIELDADIADEWPEHKVRDMKTKLHDYYAVIAQWNALVRQREDTLIRWGAEKEPTGWFIDTHGRVKAHLDSHPEDRIVLNRLGEEFILLQGKLKQCEATRVMILESFCKDMQSLMIKPIVLPPILQFDKCLSDH